jgi:opacity protein-like surface antigen
MRFVVRCFSMIGAGIIFFHAAAASAQSVAEPNTITVTPFLGGAFGTSEDLGASGAIGVALGYDMTSNLGFEGEFAHLFDVAGSDANVDSPVQNYSGNVVYHFGVKRVTPYATFGLSIEHIGRSVKNPDLLASNAPPSTEIAYNVGGGVKYPLTQNFLARADLRRFQSNDLAPDYWRLYGGLTWWIKR